MSQIMNEVLESNKNYATRFGRLAELSSAPTRRFAILTCMDARIDPAKLAGLSEGEAHVIRNAGGRASEDALRSLVISHKLAGTREWFVIHHTDCTLEHFTDEMMRDLLADSLKPASRDVYSWYNTEGGPGSRQGNYLNWLTIKDQAQSVIDDVQRIRQFPLVPPDVAIYGYIYDVKTGLLTEVPEATRIGKVLPD